MIIAIAIEDFGFHATVFLMRKLANHLEHLLVRFRTRVGIIHAAHAGHFADQFFSKKRAGNRSGCLRKVTDFHQLIAHCIGNGFAAIADVHGPNTTRYGVDILFAVLVPNTHAFAFYDDAWITGFERFVLEQVVPNMGLVSGNNA